MPWKVNLDPKSVLSLMPLGKVAALWILKHGRPGGALVLGVPGRYGESGAGKTFQGVSSMLQCWGQPLLCC